MARAIISLQSLQWLVWSCVRGRCLLSRTSMRLFVRDLHRPRQRRNIFEYISCISSSGLSGSARTSPSLVIPSFHSQIAARSSLPVMETIHRRSTGPIQALLSFFKSSNHSQEPKFFPSSEPLLLENNVRLVAAPDTSYPAPRTLTNHTTPSGVFDFSSPTIGLSALTNRFSTPFDVLKTYL